MQTTDDKRDGKNTTDGSADEKACLKEITVVGSSCMLVDARTNKVVAPSKFFLSHIFVVAEMPAGVAIPPIPRRFAEMFTARSSASSSVGSEKSFLISGFNLFEIFLTIPESSAICSTPDHIE